VAAILFDLDQFGAFNKEQWPPNRRQRVAVFAASPAPDAQGRFVARYGGEEFLVVLQGTGRETASRIADEIRVEFRALTIAGSGGGVLGATVVAAAPSSIRRVELPRPCRDGGCGPGHGKLGGRDQVVAA